VAKIHSSRTDKLDSVFYRLLAMGLSEGPVRCGSLEA
jgi:hypothetical protein